MKVGQIGPFILVPGKMVNFFTYLFWIQNFELISSRRSNNFFSELQLPWKYMHGYFIFHRSHLKWSWNCVVFASVVHTQSVLAGASFHKLYYVLLDCPDDTSTKSNSKINVKSKIWLLEQIQSQIHNYGTIFGTPCRFKQSNICHSQ